MPHDPIQTWKTMSVKVWPEEYFLAQLSHENSTLVSRAIAHSTGKFTNVSRDQFGFALFTDSETWLTVRGEKFAEQYVGPLKVLSTDSDLPFDVPGFVGTALGPVNSANLKAAPICGLMSDHFFTGADQLSEVIDIFEKFSAQVSVVDDQSFRSSR